MPRCAVITCRKSSTASSITNGGISFNRFPKDPYVKENWIDATGRGNSDWFPTKTSTICSRHFTVNNFIIKKSGNRYLKPGAIPRENVVYVHSCSIEAIELAVTPRRSLRTVKGTTLENMNLAVEVKNVCSENDTGTKVEILEASLLSREWKLTDITGARNKSDPLVPHERLHLIFKARRILETPPEGRVEYSCLKVADCHPESVDDINVPPYSKFVVEYKPPFLDTAELITKNVPIVSGSIRSMFVLRWRAQNQMTNKISVGQHCLWLDCFTKVVSREKVSPTVNTPSLQLEDFDVKLDLNETKKKNIDNFVVFRLEHSVHVNHDFQMRKLCLIPITINIVNCYSVPVQVFINMSKQQNRESSGVLGWAGALSGGGAEPRDMGVSVALGRFESRRVRVRAVCAAPGTYLLGSAFALLICRADDDSSSLVHANNTSLLIVQQA